MRIIGKISDKQLLKEFKKDRRKVYSCKKIKGKAILDGANFAKFLKAHPDV